MNRLPASGHVLARTEAEIRAIAEIQAAARAAIAAIDLSVETVLRNEERRRAGERAAARAARTIAIARTKRALAAMQFDAPADVVTATLTEAADAYEISREDAAQ